MSRLGRSFRHSGTAGLAGVALIVLGALAVPTSAQVADAVIEVAAVDASGGALPGVTVTLTRPDTGYQHTVVTDSVGVARGLALPPGSYTVRIELAGFATVVEEHVVVRVGQIARLGVTMKVAQLAETVNVVGQASLVDIFKTDSSTNIVPEQIEALPVQDRDFQRLAFLAPGFSASAEGIVSSATARWSEPPVMPARPPSWLTASTSPIRHSAWRARGSVRMPSASSASSPTGSTRRLAAPPAVPCRS
jgi:hypothetical protein